MTFFSHGERSWGPTSLEVQPWSLELQGETEPSHQIRVAWVRTNAVVIHEWPEETYPKLSGLKF